MGQFEMRCKVCFRREEDHKADKEPCWLTVQRRHREAAVKGAATRRLNAGRKVRGKSMAAAVAAVERARELAKAAEEMRERRRAMGYRC